MRVLTRRWFGSAAGVLLVASTLAAQEHSDTQAGTIVAFLRSAAAPAAEGRPRGMGGNTASGRAIFEDNGRCATCHRVNGVGRRVAADLSDIGAFLRMSVRRAPRERCQTEGAS
jgi:mono/diheme cytochrome c family protein